MGFLVNTEDFDRIKSLTGHLFQWAFNSDLRNFNSSLHRIDLKRISESRTLIFPHM